MVVPVSEIVFMFLFNTLHIAKPDSSCQPSHHNEDESYQNDGFIINFFSKKKIEELLVGFSNIKIDRFNEGDFPRKLFIVQNQKK